MKVKKQMNFKLSSHGKQYLGDVCEVSDIVEEFLFALAEGGGLFVRKGFRVDLSRKKEQNFFSILLTLERSHREVYRDFKPSLKTSTGGAKG